jgi:hypothetical protein
MDQRPIEGLQRTILQEQWRIQFRRLNFTRPAATQRPDAFMPFLQAEAAARGLPAEGLNPAVLFRGVVALAGR